MIEILICPNEEARHFVTQNFPEESSSVANPTTESSRGAVAEARKLASGRHPDRYQIA